MWNILRKEVPKVEELRKKSGIGQHSKKLSGQGSETEDPTMLETEQREAGQRTFSNKSAYQHVAMIYPVKSASPSRIAII